MGEKIMALANDIIQGAVSNISKSGPAQTVGDALSAYKMTQDLQTQQENLKMAKDKNEQEKANWVVGSLVNIAKLGGNSQRIALDTFGKRMQQAYPGYNQDFVKMFKEDEDFRRNVAQQAAGVLTRGAIKSPEQAQLVYDYLHMSSEDVAQTFEKMGQDQAHIQASQAQAAGFAQRASAQQDNGTQAALDKFTKDSKLPSLEDLGKKLDRDTVMLRQTDAKHPITYQSVHEVLQNIATVLGNGTISDARVNAISPKLGDEVSAKLKSFISNDPNQPADKDLVDYANHLVGRLNNAVGADVVARAKTIGAGKDKDLFHNPNIAEATKRKLNFYEKGSWRSDYGASETPLAQQQQQASQPVSYGQTPKEIEDAYQQYLAQKAHEAANGRR